MTKERLAPNYDTSVLPFEENLDRYAPPFEAEEFTDEEQRYLKPFFSNLDKPLYIAYYLPEEVIGALSSRYSRSVLSLRRLFLKEYVGPILNPEQQMDWDAKPKKEQRAAMQTRKKFLDYVKFIDKNGGIEGVVNTQRARKFFDTWLSQFGDDSIAEQGGAHVCMEGVSSLALEEIVSKRISLAPLVKSTRYVSFSDVYSNGEFKYVIPGEFKGTPMYDEYKQTVDGLFKLYSHLETKYFDYIAGLYPKGEDESDVSFRNSRKAKTFDDIRDLLPFATQNNMALYGNGRAFEDLINRLLSNPIGEVRWWGQNLAIELDKVEPSFVRRPQEARGAELQYYRNNLRISAARMGEELGIDAGQDMPATRPDWLAKLVSSSHDAAIDVLAGFLLAESEGASYAAIREKVQALSGDERAKYIQQIIDERKFGKDEAVREKDRFKKVPRAFENAHYLFEFFGRGGDYRDLHRHRQNTEIHPKFTNAWGYELEKEVLASPFATEVKQVMERASATYEKIRNDFSQDLAQYALPFGYMQHWFMNLTAREIYWMTELRTGPQGRPHYREICQQMAVEAAAKDPEIFSGIMTDFNDYRLARRESEKKIDKKLEKLGITRE